MRQALVGLWIGGLCGLCSLGAGCGGPDGTARGAVDAAGVSDGAIPTATVDGDDTTPDVTPDGSASAPDLLGHASLTVGDSARVSASQSLNLRTGPGTTNAILVAMPCGATVPLVGGPMNGWWNVTYQGQAGWASGNYLVAAAAFDPAVCAAKDAGAGQTTDGGLATDQLAIFARAKLAVGYSYFWGHGSWRSDGAQHGTCVGGCPSCTHTGSYGADCSGFVAKAWQIPAASSVELDLHPYSTYDFVNSTSHWNSVPRSKIQPADAMVYNASGHGHMVLFESGSDPWGNVWVYEARGCAYGVQHNLRAIASTFSTIRREGL